MGVLPEVSVIVPLFNESECVRELVKQLYESLNLTGRSFEVLLVDDGSTDDTYDIAASLVSTHKGLRVVRFRKNYGQTPAMVAGIDLARGEILVTMDGDLQNDPKDIAAFLDKIEEGYDLVVGWRYNRQDKLITRKIPSMIANRLIAKVTGVKIKDNGCSLKAYRAGLIKNVPLYSEMHRFIPAMSSSAGVRIYEMKVRHHARMFGESKYGLSRIYKVALDLLAIRTILSSLAGPVKYFGKFSLVLLVLSTLMFVVSVFQDSMIFFAIATMAGVNAMVWLFWGFLCDLLLSTGGTTSSNLAKLTLSATKRAA